MGAACCASKILLFSVNCWITQCDSDKIINSLKCFCNVFTPMCCLYLCMCEFFQLQKLKFPHTPPCFLVLLSFLSYMLCVARFANCIVFPDTIIFSATLSFCDYPVELRLSVSKELWTKSRKGDGVLDPLQWCWEQIQRTFSFNCVKQNVMSIKPWKPKKGHSQI